MIDAASLPRPARVEFEDGSVMNASPWRDGTVLRTAKPDAQVAPRRLQLIYESTPAAALKAVRDHYRQWCDTDWDWTCPGDSAPSRWIYREPTQIKFATNASGSGRASIEEALAHD
jgi:hypothetical protein